MLSRARYTIWLNTLSFIALHLLPIPIKNNFVSLGLNLPFTKDIAFTVLSLGWYKGLRKNRVALENENSSEKYSRNESTYNPYLIGNQLKGILPEGFLSQNPGLIADSGANEAQTIVPKLLLNKIDKERKGRKMIILKWELPIRNLKEKIIMLLFLLKMMQI